MGHTLMPAYSPPQEHASPDKLDPSRREVFPMRSRPHSPIDMTHTRDSFSPPVSHQGFMDGSVLEYRAPLRPDGHDGAFEEHGPAQQDQRPQHTLRRVTKRINQREVDEDVNERVGKRQRIDQHQTEAR